VQTLSVSIRTSISLPFCFLYNNITFLLSNQSMYRKESKDLLSKFNSIY
jgi:predicted HAD superfamily hydrolase